MSGLQIRFRKKSGETSSMICYRADGTSTGQRAGNFFVMHDLGHYAVETTLNLRAAFFGLVARGWEIEEFSTRWSEIKALPDVYEELMLGEALAGMLDRERGGFPPCNAEEFPGLFLSGQGETGMKRSRRVTDAELLGLREAANENWQTWALLPLGETLELWFPLRDFEK